MARSKRKPIFTYKEPSALYEKSTTVRRKEAIPSFAVGSTVSAYNGQKRSSYLVTDQAVGHKVGEFFFTRKIGVHKKKKR